MRNTAIKLIAALILVGAGAAVTTPAAAQTREGFYISGGIGWGWYYQRCGSCGAYATNSTDNYVYYFGFGTTVKPSLRVGLQADGYNNTKNSVTQNLVFYNLMASLYPKPESPLWVKLGLGYAYNKIGGSSASGISFAVGLGFDITPGHGKFAIIPYANYDYQFGGGATSGSTATNVKASLLQFGIGIGLRH